MRTVLFLCTGNYYRSRFAEIYFNWHVQQSGLPWRAESRGLDLDPTNVGHMSRYTAARLREVGIDLQPYWRSPLDVSDQDLADSHHIVAVKQAEHRPLMDRRFPQHVHRVEFWHVHDIDYALPSQAIPQLEEEVHRLIERLATSQLIELSQSTNRQNGTGVN